MLPAATLIAAALIAGCGGGDPSDQPTPNASAQAKATTTPGKPASSESRANESKQGRRKAGGEGRPGGGTPSCATAQGAAKKKLACYPPGKKPADTSADVTGAASVYADPDLARCVKEAGDNADAKNACLPPEAAAKPAEPTPEEQALTKCAEAADTAAQKNACLD